MKEPEVIYLRDTSRPWDTVSCGVSGDGWPQKAWVPKTDYDALAARLEEVCDAMTCLQHAITSYVGDIPERNLIGRAYAKLSIAIVRATQGADSLRTKDGA